MGDLRPWEDPDHPGNAIRPEVRCLGCGVMGCITTWGPWCFSCNVARFRYLTAHFDEIEEAARRRAADGRDVWCSDE